MAEKGTRNTAVAFGDFTISVAMKKAAFSRDVKLDRIHADGTPFRGVAPGGIGNRRGVDPARGESYALKTGDEYLRVPQDELDAIEEDSKDRYATMTVLETIDYRQVPTERIVGAYWLQPKDGTAKGLRLLAEALRHTGRVAVVKWVATTREKLGVIRVRGDRGNLALLLSEITFANDFLEADEDALSINEVPEPATREIDAAMRLVKSYARSADTARHGRTIDSASDEAVDARIALLARVQNGELERALSATEEELVVEGAPGAASK